MRKPSALLLPAGLILAMVLISGCTALGGLFGGDVINVQQSIVQNGVQDVVIVKDILTIPKSPLLPDQQLSLSFILENKDKLKNVENVRIDLFNAPTMRNAGGTTLCNLYVASGYSSTIQSIGSGYEMDTCNNDNDCGAGFACNPSGIGCSCTSSTLRPGSCPNSRNQIAQTSNQRYCIPDQCGAEGCIILPGEEKPITFTLMTPSSNDIKNIKTDTKLDFKATYEFDGSLNYIVSAISTDEIVKRQRSGDKANLFTTKSYGSGPVQIDVELQGAPYILSGSSPISTGQPETVMFFTIKNRGSGTLVNSQIDSDQMQIIFPPELEVVNGKYSEQFSCTDNGQNTVCKNTGSVDSTGKKVSDGVIPLYRDQSRSSLRFTVKLKQPLNEPFRSFQITSTVTYNYELRNSVAMTINPFQNV
ncbi:MAG TPA: hypothetical protein VJB05_02850 [archaeon]|nr:hypothetical protein [archaeon]